MFNYLSPFMCASLSFFYGNGALFKIIKLINAGE